MTWIARTLAFIIIHAALRGEVEEYELFEGDEDKPTNFSIACGVCEARGGILAVRPTLDDWDITFGNLSYMANMSFWVDLMNFNKSGVWYWGDTAPLDLALTSSLPMSSNFSSFFNSTWKCAVWNMAEPFLKPVPCSSWADIMCAVPPSKDECNYTRTDGKKLNISSSVNITSEQSDTVDQCKERCVHNSNCWIADYDTDKKVCRLVTNSSRPELPQMEDVTNFVVIAKICAQYKLISKSDSNFLCNCAVKRAPETPEEMDQFEEEYKEKVKKELVVEKDSLSATVRKKISIPDERKSSAGLGIMGIAMMAVVFGGLVLLDLTSLFAHAKMAFNNIRALFESDSSDA